MPIFQWEKSTHFLWIFGCYPMSSEVSHHFPLKPNNLAYQFLPSSKRWERDGQLRGSPRKMLQSMSPLKKGSMSIWCQLIWVCARTWDTYGYLHIPPNSSGISSFPFISPMFNGHFEGYTLISDTTISFWIDGRCCCRSPVLSGDNKKDWAMMGAGFGHIEMKAPKITSRGDYFSIFFIQLW